VSQGDTAQTPQAPDPPLTTPVVPAQAAGREIRTFTGHAYEVSSVSFSPDGRTALSGGDKTLKLWDVATGREIRRFTGHTEPVNSVSFSPDGRTALSGSYDKTLKLWDVATGREIRTLTGHTGSVFSVSFSPDGRSALSGSTEKTIKLWDIASGSAPSAPPPSPSDRVSQGDTAQTPQAPAPPSATPVVPAQATVTDLLNGKKISMSIRCRRNQPSQNTVSGVSLNSQGNLMYSSRGNVPLEIVNGRARDSLFKYSATVSGNELTVVTTPATGDLSLRTTDTFKVSGNSCSATHTVDNGGMLEIDDTCKATSCTVASAP